MWNYSLSILPMYTMGVQALLKIKLDNESKVEECIYYIIYEGILEEIMGTKQERPSGCQVFLSILLCNEPLSSLH